MCLSVNLGVIIKLMQYTSNFIQMKENPTKEHLNVWKITALSTNKDMGYVLVEIIKSQHL